MKIFFSSDPDSGVLPLLHIDSLCPPWWLLLVCHIVMHSEKSATMSNSEDSVETQNTANVKGNIPKNNPNALKYAA